MLDRNALFEKISNFSDENLDSFEGWAETIEEAAEKWSVAFFDFSKGITPISTTTQEAKESFKNAFISGINNVNMNCLEVAFTAGASTLALGMQPIFTGVPPSSRINFTPVSVLGLTGATGSQCAELLSTIAFIWMSTGTAINNNTGITLPWS